MTGLRTLVIGAGAIARRIHLPILTRHPEVSQIRVADTDAATARRVATEFGVEVADGIHHDVDLVVVCTPPAAHTPLVRTAVRAGCDVVVEKPLATSAAEAWEVARLAERSGRFVHVCYTNRYRADVRALTRLVRSGRLGEPLEVSARWLRRNGVPGTAGGREAGVLWDLGSHLSDLCVGLIDRLGAATVFGHSRKAERVPASSWYEGNSGTAELSCGFTGTVIFDDGPSLRLAVAWHCATELDRVEVDVVGSKATARLRTVFGFSPDRGLLGGPVLEIVDSSTGDRAVVLADQVREPTEYAKQYEPVFARPDHARTLRGIRQAARSVALCEALFDSAGQARPVTVRLDDGEEPRDAA